MRSHDPPPTLIMKPTEDADFGPISPQDRESIQSELIYSQRLFNNIIKLKKIFLKAFNQNEWHCNHTGKKFSFTHKQDNTRELKIEKMTNELRFQGLPLEKIVESAHRYESEAGVEMKYMISANSLDAAVNYLKALDGAHFDITKIKQLNIQAKNNRYDIKALIAQIKKPTLMDEAKLRSRKSAKKNPKS